MGHPTSSCNCWLSTVGVATLSAATLETHRCLPSRVDRPSERVVSLESSRGAVTCDKCTQNVISFDELCPGCGTQLSPTPNVRRLAMARYEELSAEYERILATADPVRVSALIAHARESSRVVVNIRSSNVRDLLEHPNQTYGNFGMTCLPNESSIAPGGCWPADGCRRPPVWTTCPRYSLWRAELDGAGAIFYGDCSVTLKTESIQHRISLLIDNPFNVTESAQDGDAPRQLGQPTSSPSRCQMG